MVKDNLLKINERIFSICSKINRDPESITIVAVSKDRTAEQIREVIAAGVFDIGENRVQEAIMKYNAMRQAVSDMQQVGWHMVGHLQTNKVKYAVKIFDLIQSVDSLRLALEIDRQAARINKIQDILIEVKTSSEATKFGVKPNEVMGLINELKSLKNIIIKGLMTIAPFGDNPEEARPYFQILRQLFDKINELRVTSYKLRILSMGMTDDFEIAIEQGSNMIRLGRAIFEG